MSRLEHRPRIARAVRVRAPRLAPHRAAAACLLALLAVSCDCRPRYRPRPLTPEAAAVLANAEGRGPALSAVLDLEALRVRELLPRDGGGPLAGDLVVAALALGAPLASDESTRVLLAEAAVAAWLLREWKPRPHVQRVAAYLHAFSPRGRAADGALIVLAVDQPLADNQALLAGVAALDRASRTPRLAQEDDLLCLELSELPVSPCARAGNGWVALGTAAALGTLREQAPKEGPPPVVAPSDDLLRVRAALPGLAGAELVVRKEEELLLSARVEAPAEDSAADLEAAVRAEVGRLERLRLDARSALEPSVREARAALAEDPQAPLALREAAQRLTPDAVIDPGGRLAQVEQTLLVSREGRQVAVSARVPDALVREVLASRTALTLLPALAASALGAVERYASFACHSRQAEAKAALRVIHALQRAHLSESDEYATRFSGLGFTPDESSRYSYCLGDECLACRAPGCRFDMRSNPCHEALLLEMAAAGEEWLVCAYGDIDGGDDPDDWDVWIIGESGHPIHVMDDCE